MKIDKKIIKELSDYLDEFNLTELEYTEKDTKIKVSKNNVSINNQNIPSSISNLKTDTTNKKEEVKSGVEITSPIIGTAKWSFINSSGTTIIFPSFCSRKYFHGSYGWKQFIKSQVARN